VSWQVSSFTRSVCLLTPDVLGYFRSLPSELHRHDAFSDFTRLTILPYDIAVHLAHERVLEARGYGRREVRGRGT
jgi:hypothetical protein